MISFQFFLFIAHLQAVLIPIFLSLKTIGRYKQFMYSFLIPLGFTCLGMASMFEMLDHTKTDWIYINHSSLFNWLFYSFLSLGLTFLSTSVIRNKVLIYSNFFICILSIFSYLIIGKSFALIFQIFISLFLISNWQRIFKDWFFLAYPIFGILFTTFFGIALSSTSDQFWHIFIGPSGSISVISFYLVLNRSQSKNRNFKI